LNFSESSDEETIFEAALQAASPAERAATLEQLCGNNAELRLRIESLLEAFEHSEALEADGQHAAALAGIFGGLEGKRVGDYQVLERIGEGGMGEVYLARSNLSPNPVVAVKAIKPGMDTRQVIARFDLERRALQSLEHPYIAKYVDSGVLESGRAYFVMELVRGLPITDFCLRHNLSLEARIHLFVDVCDGVEYANQNGLIHRDLKPSNLLVCEVAGKAIVKIIDFGVAKALACEPQFNSIFTGAVQWLGTPVYMSPEQARWSSDVDARSDVYSLGVLLFEILTGSTPIELPREQKLSFEELRLRILEEAAPLPSQRAKAALSQSPALSQNEQAELVKRTKGLRGKVDWVVLKALEKDRKHRYASAGALQADLRAILEHRPVTARPPSIYGRLGMLRRQFTLANSMAFVAVLITALALFALPAMRGVRREFSEPTTAVESRLEEAGSRFVNDVKATADFLRQGEWQAARDSLAPYMNRDNAFHNNFAVQHLQSRFSIGEVQHSQHTDLVLDADLSSDGRWVASVDRSGEVVVWDRLENRQTKRWRQNTREVVCVRFSPNGELLATSGQDGMLRIWEVPSWELLAEFPGHERTISALAWSATSQKVATGDREGIVCIWTVDTKMCERPLGQIPSVIQSLAWSHNNRFLAVTNRTVGVQIWNTETWMLHATLNDVRLDARAVTFSQDDQQFAAGGYGRSVAIAETQNGQILTRLTCPGSVSALTFGRFRELYAGIEGGEMRILQDSSDAWANTQALKLGNKKSWVRRIMLTADELSLGVVVDDSKSVQWLSTQAIHSHKVMASSDPPIGYCAEIDAVFTFQKPGVLVWGRDGVQQGDLTLPTEVGRCAPAYSQTLGLLAVVGQTNKTSEIYLVDMLERKIARRKSLPFVARRVYFDCDSQHVIAAGSRGAVGIWDLEADAFALIPEFMENPSSLTAHSAISPTEQRFVASDGITRRVNCYDLRSKSLIKSVETDSPATALVYSPDGRSLAIGEAGRISIWTADLSKQVATTIQMTDLGRASVFDACFSADGATLATFLEDGTVKILDTPSHRELISIPTFVRPEPSAFWWMKFRGTSLVFGSGGAKKIILISGGAH
jgi:serine/threonine protein kinase/WD40 repeat protein